jgi:hypothetical protein
MAPWVTLDIYSFATEKKRCILSLFLDKKTHLFSILIG